jgi:FKBP-type peptidyl-prolyl cis-trans isomerase SlyD
MMEIGPQKTAKIIYSISIVEQDEPDKELTVDQTATFQFGTNQLLPAFEAKLIGLRSGHDFDFIIKAKDAYGPIDPYAIFDIPKDTFEVDGQIDEKMLQVGNLIPMHDNDGNEHIGKILTILETVVTMDFNHQLAGKDLRFKGKIIEINAN